MALYTPVLLSPHIIFIHTNIFSSSKIFQSLLYIIIIAQPDTYPPEAIYANIMAAPKLHKSNLETNCGGSLLHSEIGQKVSRNGLLKKLCPEIHVPTIMLP